MIYGIGLPRTATSTLSECLRLMGYQGYSFCELTKQLCVDKHLQFSVDNSYHATIEYLASRAYPEDVFILTVRDDASWSRSVNKFEEMNYSLPLPSVYQAKVESLIPEDKLLVINFTAGDEWEKLCKFLKRDVPEYGFPCKNC